MFITGIDRITSARYDDFAKHIKDRFGFDESRGKFVLKLVFRPILEKYHSVLRRLHDLDVAVDTMLLNPTWILDTAKVFNGQERRRSLFEQIATTFTIDEVIETGTFLGDTTGHLAHRLPHAAIRSCELSPRFTALARQRLAMFPNVSVQCADSRKFLATLDPKTSHAEDTLTFAYLDAHWHADLPLKEELHTLLEKRQALVIMVDDFEVPNDPGYAYDRYGHGRDLNWSTFGQLFIQLGLEAFVPVASSEEETGFRRGSVILAPKGPVSVRLAQLTSLKLVSVGPK